MARESNYLKFVPLDLRNSQLGSLIVLLIVFGIYFLAQYLYFYMIYHHILHAFSIESSIGLFDLLATILNVVLNIWLRVVLLNPDTLLGAIILTPLYDLIPFLITLYSDDWHFLLPWYIAALGSIGFCFCACCCIR